MSKKEVKEIVRWIKRTNKRFERGIEKRVKNDIKKAGELADDFYTPRELYDKEQCLHHE